MAVHRSRPGNPEVRKGECVGPSYPASHFNNPWNMGIDAQRDDEHSKTLRSPTLTTEGPGISLNHDYDKFWEGK